MRPVVKSVRTAGDGTPLEFKPHGDAKPDLCDEIGTFCSFCGKYNTRASLHIEHIHGKETMDATGNLKYPHLLYRWDNFLLCCNNCNGVKGTKDVQVLQPYLPHENNLLHFIDTLQGGYIQIRPGVTGIELQRTQAFVDLVGLDRIPGHPNYSLKDDRWENRMKADDIARRQLLKYTQPVPATDIETIVDLAGTTGFLNVWYHVFSAFDEVKEALICGFINSNGLYVHPFPGTHGDSFDRTNGFSTTARPK
ncbi:hypothetical protein SAMN05421788_102558 [Filimonas lacunae]|uniref:TIGR02646 family protein n=1 Tax=Filimonas lacunae TaxID=477680 RepID=A0A173MH52_9BACT|nr:hypothetical protein [Filimonas lacunae]BAV06807.1 hypothetical transmembrane protein [Filimonas lacunae]SIS99474.1 hypothetical protein SAMN05421788_102558 [Filimonas lacunae]